MSIASLHCRIIPDPSIVKEVDAYKYEWSLYGLDELESKKKAWSEVSNFNISSRRWGGGIIRRISKFSYAIFIFVKSDQRDKNSILAGNNILN